MPRSPASGARSRSTLTAPNDPVAIRRAALGLILEVAEAEAALFYTVGETARGPRALGNQLTLGGDAVFGPWAASAIGAGWSSVAASLPDVRRCSARETRTFLESAALWSLPEAFAQRPLTMRIRAATGLFDQIRLLAFHGERYLGWIGAFRRAGDAPFGAAERKRLAPHVAELTSRLAAADALERGAGASEPAFLVVTPDGGSVEASASARAWLAEPGFRDALGATIGALDRGQGAELERVLGRADARIVRLDGDGAVRYLVCLRPATSVRRSLLATLSPAQRRVAELFAAGLQRREIARELAIGVETVRSHLRAAYERLGVADRVELARVVAAETAP